MSRVLITILCLGLIACGGEVSTQDVKMSELTNYIEQSWMLDGEELREITVWDENDQPIKVTNILKDSTLVLYVTTDMCSSCVMRQVGNIMELSKEIGTDRIVVVVRDLKDIKNWFLYNEIISANIKIVRSRLPILLSCPIFMPTCFIYENGRAIKCYQTSKLVEELDLNYINVVKKYYKNKV